MSVSLERFQYDPNKSIESQIAAFLHGRNPYGTQSDPNWFKDPNQYEAYAVPDESGTLNYGYRAKNPRLADVSPGAVGPDWNTRIVDGQYTPIGWSPSKDPAAINGLKPDNMYDYGKMYYDPEFGLVMDGNNVRDPDARHDAWYGAGLMAAVAGPAIAGIMGAAGAGAGGGSGLGGTMTGAAGDESLGLAGTGTYGGGTSGGLLGAGDESAGLSTGGGHGTSGGLLGGAETGSELTPLEGVHLQPETLYNVMDPTPLTFDPMMTQPWYQQALQGLLNNPQNAARLGMGLYSMFNANQGNVGGNPAGGANGDPGSLANTAGMPQFNPMQAMGQFQQNPWLLAQMGSVPFMSGERHGMGF